MGLAERRAMQEFKDKVFPGLKAEVNAAAGFDVPMDVHWDSLAVEGYSGLYNESIPKVFFTPLCDALKAVAADDMGKSALKSGLKKIKIANTLEKANPDGFTFTDGELVLDHLSQTNIDNIDERTQAIKALLEAKL